jgi:pSer/pThr/pTyr-binding forkhead associated (FHA) protein
MTPAPVALGLLASLKRFVFGFDTASMPEGFDDRPRREPSRAAVAQPSGDYLFSALDEAATNFLGRFSFSEMQRLQFRLKQVDVHVPSHLASLASWLLQTPAEARREAAATKLRALDPEFRLDLSGFGGWNICIGPSAEGAPAGAVVEELHVYTQGGAGQPGIHFAFVGELHNHPSLTRVQLKQQHERTARKAGGVHADAGHSLTYRFTGTGEMRTLTRFPVQAGSSEEADLHLAGTAVSRLHAVFEVGPNGQLGVRDTSTNGTWLNGTRLRHNEFHPLGARGVMRFCAAAEEPRSVEMQYTVSSGGREATELIGSVGGKAGTTPVIGVTPEQHAAAAPASHLTIEKWFGDGHRLREAVAQLPHVVTDAGASVRLSAAGREGFVLAELQSGSVTMDGAPVPRFFVLAADGRRSLRLGQGCSVALHAPAAAS